MSIETEVNVAGEIDKLFDKIRSMNEKQRREEAARIRAETNQNLLARQREIRDDLMEDREKSRKLGIDRIVYAEPRDREYDIWNIAAYYLARRELKIN